MKLTDISGNYIYRSLLNDPVWGEDFYALKFGEGLMVLKQDDGHITGTFDMGSGYKMTLEGRVTHNGTHNFLRMTAFGIPNSPTNGWIYDYFGMVDPIWPDAVNQIPTVTGSVIRTVDHGSSKAGVTATFYMVQRG